MDKDEKRYHLVIEGLKLPYLRDPVEEHIATKIAEMLQQHVHNMNKRDARMGKARAGRPLVCRLVDIDSQEGRRLSMAQKKYRETGEI